MEERMMLVPEAEWLELKRKVEQLSEDLKAIRLRDTEYLTISEACCLLRVGRTTLWRYRQEGKLQSLVISGKMVISKTEIQDAIERGLIVPGGG